jgi:predicted nucleic acid-binding protein
VALSGSILDKSAAARVAVPRVHDQLAELAADLTLCPVGELEQLYSAQSATQYNELKSDLHADLQLVPVPSDMFDSALRLQRDLAHHHGLWRRIPLPDLLIAETAMYHRLGVVHVDGDFDRIAEVRPLVVRRLRA